MFNATICNAVVAGTCVWILDEAIVYAGPIKHCPEIVDGTLMLLNTKDFEILQAHIKRHQN
jgi:hypothetical protein